MPSISLTRRFRLAVTKASSSAQTRTNSSFIARESISHYSAGAVVAGIAARRSDVDQVAPICYESTTCKRTGSARKRVRGGQPYGRNS